MSGVITTGSFPKQLWPGLNKIWGIEYKSHAEEYTSLFDTSTSDKNYEEDVGMSAFGLVPVKPEGSAISYDTMKQTYVSRYTHVTYGLGFIITREQIDDNLYMSVGEKGAKSLAFSFQQTRENVGANVYNNGFSSSYTGGDGVSLFNTAHPIDGGTASNTLAVAADLSEASLEQMLIDIGNAVDPKGLKINLMAQTLIVPVQLQFDAKRILGDPERPATADRDINAMYHMGMFPGGYKVNHYLTDADAFFVRTNLKDTIRHFNRRDAGFEQDNDFDTENAKYKCTGRYSFGWSDWRGAWGSPGA
jgi:hypothetical protein